MSLSQEKSTISSLREIDITLELFGKFGSYLAEDAVKSNGEHIKPGSGPVMFSLLKNAIKIKFPNLAIWKDDAGFSKITYAINKQMCNQ